MTASEGDLSHHRDGRARRAASGVLWMGLNHLVPAASGLVVFILVSRVIGPEEFGFVAFAAVIVATVGAFSPAGFGDALVQRAEIENAHLNATFWLCALWGLGLYGLVAMAAGPVSVWLNTPMLAVLLPIIGVRLIFDLCAVVPMALLSRRMRFQKIAIRTLAASLLSMTACLAVLQLGYGFWALVASQLTASLTLSAVGWLSVSWRPSARLQLSALGDIKGFGGYSSASRVITTINVEQMLIGSLLGSAALGLIAFARRVFDVLNGVLTKALAGVAYPLLSSMQDEDDKLRQAYLAMVFLSSVLAFPVFIGLALIAPDAVVLVFGPQWEGAVPILRALCSIGLLSCVGILQAAMIRARGRADWWMWYQAAQQTLSAIVVVALFPLGTVAVAVGIAVKTWLTFPIMVMLVGRAVDLPMRRFCAQFPTAIIGCAAMTAAVLGVRAGLDLPEGWSLVAQIAVGAAGYALTVALIARRRLSELLAVIRVRKG